MLVYSLVSSISLFMVPCALRFALSLSELFADQTSEWRRNFRQAEDKLYGYEAHIMGTIATIAN